MKKNEICTVIDSSQFGRGFQLVNRLDDPRGTINRLVAEERIHLFDLGLRVASAFNEEVVSILLELDETDADEPSQDVFDSFFEASVELGYFTFLVELGDNHVKFLNHFLAIDDHVLLTDSLNSEKGNRTGIEQVLAHLVQEVGDGGLFVGLGDRDDVAVSELDIPVLLKVVNSLVNVLMRDVSFFHDIEKAYDFGSHLCSGDWLNMALNEDSFDDAHINHNAFFDQ
jgi:hypothetical protein